MAIVSGVAERCQIRSDSQRVATRMALKRSEEPNPIASYSARFLLFEYIYHLALESKAGRVGNYFVNMRYFSETLALAALAAQLSNAQCINNVAAYNPNIRTMSANQSQSFDRPLKEALASY